jgi:glycosyltransferase involved in cell wall biosynthesis
MKGIQINSTERPVISIITACFNSETNIEQTIQSVIGQTYPNIEYIIIDGGSTDKTLDIIKKYNEKITKLVSEPDSGVYDAMNKGIAVSTGEIIQFLNSGDYLQSIDTIEKVSEAFSDKSIFGVYGNVEIFNESGGKTRIRGCKVTYKSLLYRRICHQALFVRRCLFIEIGLFSTKFKYSSDHEFIVKSIKRYPSNFLYLNMILAKYRQGGMSCKMMEITKIEDLKIIWANYNWIQFWFGALICAFVILKYKIPQILKIERFAY